MIVSNTKSKQSLLNECKGHLFEYLFAKSLVDFFPSTQNLFFKSFNEDDWKRLKDYQQVVHQLDPVLFQQLPQLSLATAKYYLQKIIQQSVISVDVVSRLKNAEHNADVIVELNNLEKHYLSLKLSKDHVFVNTKSAGIKSFLTKYFPFAGDGQDKINAKVSQAFDKMRYQMLDFHGYDLSIMNFKEWANEGHSHLPSHVPPILRESLLDYYHQSIMSIYEEVEKLFMTHKDQVCQSFESLCGLSYQSQHLFCFHQGTQHYRLSRIVDLALTDMSKQIPQILPPSRGSSYFLVIYKKMKLQIRVKPMRDFTAPAMKINCAIKF